MGLPIAVPEFTFDLDDSRESSFRIEGVEGLIEQIIGNVIDNAFKYSMPNSTIKIEYFLAYQTATLVVQNEPLPGLELDEDTVNKCRVKNWRSKGATASDADGTGLGLWLVDRIMGAHDGKLIIEQTNDEGWNTFRLQFPLV